MEAFPLRAVAHGERLTVIQHLSELRARLLLSVAVLAVLFAGVCGRAGRSCTCSTRRSLTSERTRRRWLAATSCPRRWLTAPERPPG
jgi:hypothetical protein